MPVTDLRKKSQTLSPSFGRRICICFVIGSGRNCGRFFPNICIGALDVLRSGGTASRLPAGHVYAGRFSMTASLL